MQIEIQIDDLSNQHIIAFLEEHLEDMKAVSPPESKHALDLEGLRKPEITFWTLWQQGKLIGCGALKELSAEQAEIKSMRVSSSHRGQGVASELMRHIVDEAEKRGYCYLKLETGSMSYFESARKLYEKFGFKYCAPFADYKEDKNSVFMMKTLSKNAAKNP